MAASSGSTMKLGYFCIGMLFVLLAGNLFAVTGVQSALRMHKAATVRLHSGLEQLISRGGHGSSTACTDAESREAVASAEKRSGPPDTAAATPSHGQQQQPPGAGSPPALPAKPLPTLMYRDALGDLFQAEGFRSGAELGVQAGAFSKQLLSRWPSAEKFFLVDSWRHQENYQDFANGDEAAQDAALLAAREALREFEPKLVWLRNFTRDAAEIIRRSQGSLDFVYIDARHDYCGVMEDLRLYWPLVRRGGVMAGHDYETAPDVRAVTPGQDWAVCGDSTRHEGAVKGAVDEFFGEKGVQVMVTYKEQHWNSWYARKP